MSRERRRRILRREPEEDTFQDWAYRSLASAVWVIAAVLVLAGAFLIANGSEWLDVVTAGDVIIALAIIAAAFIIRAGLSRD